MNLGVTTVLVGGVIGLALTIFGAKMLITGRAPAATAKSFRTTHDAALYHLMFGIGLIVLAVGTSAPGGAITATSSAVIAVVLVVIAVARHRPRKPADPAPARATDLDLARAAEPDLAEAADLDSGQPAEREVARSAHGGLDQPLKSDH